MKRINFITIFACLFTSCSTLQKVNNETVESFDLNKYLGTWYEIARFDHIFERGMDHNKAVYNLQNDGLVNVKNSALKNGKPKEITGIAKISNTPGLLRVSFFRPFYADYRVMYIDKDYQYALIGSGSSDYLWILSRTPNLNEETKNNLLIEASRRGYNINNLMWIDQE